MLFEPRYEVDGTGRLFVFDSASGALSACLETGRAEELVGLGFAGESRWLIAFGKTGRLHLWDLPDTKRKEIMPDWQQLFERGRAPKNRRATGKKHTVIHTPTLNYSTSPAGPACWCIPQASQLYENQSSN
ncbi:MAG: hypothetical protein P9M00_11155 [Candidatus Tritonobacter lacicola]|nr:hypothetical protein [Candidatus Tritonobacter lacicola]